MDISIEAGNNLVIKGHRTREFKVDDVQGGTRFERFFGAYRRSITLPSHADSSNPRAEFSNGIDLSSYNMEVVNVFVNIRGINNHI